MDHFINHIEIQNFKSIRELKLSGFKRINLFIGRPNVGKSNLLEALSLFALPGFWYNNERITDLIRLSRSRDIFYEGDVKTSNLITARNKIAEFSCVIRLNIRTNGLTIDIEELHKEINSEVEDASMRYEIDSVDKYFQHGYNSGHYDNIIKPYYFKKGDFSNVIGYLFLTYPFGDNLYDVLELNSELRKTYAQWFRQYGLRLVLDTSSQSLKVQRDNGDEVFQLPYSSVADTLQRIIFYKTAIASNENSVLLFEEPEAHAYPPYISEFTQEVIGSKTNQTFIVTHSPLIVNDMLDNAIDDLAIFMVDFRDGQTVARPLTDQELHDVRKFGVDLFFNSEAYPV